MKKITSLILLMLCSLVGYSQTFSTGFETGIPAGWIISNNGNGVNNSWSVNNTAGFANSGESSLMVFPETTSIASPIQDWIITSQVNLTGIINPKLSFYGKKTPNGPTRNSRLEVMISTTNTDMASFQSIAIYDDYNSNAPNPISPANDSYGFHELSLLDYTGETVYIAFVMINEGIGKTWFLDDIELIDDCPEVTGNVVGDISATSATVSWTNPMNVPSFEIDVMLESENPTTFTADYTTTTNTQVLSNLQPNTPYKYYIKSVCSPNASSEWIGPFEFGTTPLPAPLAYEENFENYHGWQFINGSQVNKWYVGTATHNGGQKSMYISNNEGVNNAYTTSTSSVTQAYRDLIIPTGTSEIQVSFDWKAAGESSFDYLRVWMVPTSFTPTAGTQITAANSGGVQIGANLNQKPEWTTENFVVDASAFAGGNVRLVFEWRNDGSGGTQPPAAVDNINVKVITCSAPSNLVLDDFTQNSADVSWTAPVNAPLSYDYYVSQINTTPTDATPISGNTTGTTLTLSDLSPGQVYYVWVRSNCGPTNGNSFLVGPLVINTLQIPAPLPYNENFDGVEVVFGFSNGLQPNKWMVGSNTFLSPNNSLYISNDNATNSYAIGNTSVTQAYRDIQIPANSNEILISFDWKGIGEGTTWDYMRVWLVPSTFTPTPGTQISAANSGGVQLGGNLNQQTDWVSFSNILNVSAFSDTTRRLVFEWRNDGGGGTQPPAAVDNILIKAVTCSAPSNLVLDAVTQNTAQISWTAPANSVPTSYDYFVSQTATTPTDTTVPAGNVTDTTVTIDDLLPGQTYYFWVRGNCGEDGNAVLLGPLTFFTSQIPAELNFFDGFEGDSGFTLSNNVNLPNKWIIGNAVSASGDKSLYISNDGAAFQYTTSTSATVVHAFRDIAIPADLTTDLAVSFDWRNQGESNFDYMRVWIVPVTFTPMVGTQITAASGGTQLGGNYQLSNTWSNELFLYPGATFAGQTIRLVFEWRNDGGGGAQSPAAVDNVEIKALTCGSPIELQALNGPNGSLNLTWEGVNTETQWELVIQPTGTGSPGDAPATSIIVNGNPSYNFMPVEGEMYEFYVRAICSEIDNSFWAGPSQFSIFRPDACADLDVTPLDLNVNANGDYVICDGEAVTVELDANFDANSFKATTSYDVEQIEYAPPFPFTGGIEMNVNVDDTWASPFTLPFEVCFYGNEFSSVQVSSNGFIRFGSNFTAGAPWQMNGTNGTFTSSFPDPNYDTSNFRLRNAIMGVYQDIDPVPSKSPNASINYQVLGTYPCRALVVNYSDIALYGCNTTQPKQNYQIVIYEITNIIEVYVANRESCGASGHNGGKGAIGLINADGTQATIPPGRNVGTWTAQNEAWRFKPSGETSPTFGWYQDGVLISDNPQHTVEINENTHFEAVISYPGCGGEDLVLRKGFDVKVTEEIILPQAGEIVICIENLDSPDRGRINDNDDVILSNLGNPTNFSMTYYHTEQDADAGVNAILDPENYVPSSFPEIIYVRVENNDSGCYGITSFSVREGILPEFDGENQVICTNYTLPILPPNQKYLMYEVLDPLTQTIATDVVNEPAQGTLLGLGFYEIYIEVESVDKCVEVFSYKVYVLPCEIPRGISPNGDGKNDYLDLTFYMTQDLKIFNRHGKVVYSHGPGYTNQWHGQSNNGGELPSGTYFYNIVTPYEHFTGWIQLVREQN